MSERAKNIIFSVLIVLLLPAVIVYSVFNITVTIVKGAWFCIVSDKDFSATLNEVYDLF